MKMILALATPLLVTAACNTNDTSEPTAPAQAAQASQAGAHVIAVAVDGNGFTPASVTVPEGQKTVLRFTRTTDATCAKQVVFPALHVEKALPLNTAVDVSIPTDSARELAFQCGMGMLKGSAVVR